MINYYGWVIAVAQKRYGLHTADSNPPCVKYFDEYKNYKNVLQFFKLVGYYYQGKVI